MESRHLILLIHGIRTKRTSASWPKHFSGYVSGLVDVITEAVYYEAAPLPIWNTLVKNPRLAKDLESRVVTRLLYDHHPLKVSIVAHSNGGCVAPLLMRRLAASGIRTETVILTGAANDSDVESSGLEELVADGMLRRAIAYSSPDDGVTRPWLEWIPGFYGALGSRGFHRAGKPTGLRVEGYQPLTAGGEWGATKHRFVTRWFPAYGHGEYYDANVRRRTFNCILEDLGLTAPADQ